MTCPSGVPGVRVRWTAVGDAGMGTRGRGASACVGSMGVGAYRGYMP